MDIITRILNGRNKVFEVYRSKYFNYFMNNYRYKELDYQKNDFIFRTMWNIGKIAAFENELKRVIKKEDSDNKYMVLGFADYIGSKWNMYDFVVELNLINHRGVSTQLVPSRIMVVDKDVVIGFAQRNKRSVNFIVSFYLNKIVDLEMLIDVQMKIHKMPFVVKVTEENKKRMEEIMRQLMKDDPVLWMNASEIGAIEAFLTGAPYIIDKLYQAKQFYENELMTYLGIDNLGGSEKKEHLINAEVESNDMLIKDSADCFVDSMREFGERVEKVLGYKLTLECKSETYLEMMEEDNDEEDEEDEDDPKEE